MPNKVPPIFHEGDCHPMEGVQLTVKNYYSKLEAMIEEKKMPDVSCSRISLSEGGVLSHNREYLRIRRKDFMFDVCAAPFGTPSFISWRFGERPRGFKALLLWLGIVNAKSLKESGLKTYYQYDTNFTFKTVVKNCIYNSIDSFEKPDKGRRGFVEIGSSVQPLETV
jgi:hypothetical protein